MATIIFPDRLAALLKGSALEAPIRGYADRAGEILAAKDMPFFPDYTDHSHEHINQVLQSEVDLVPQEVWDQSGADSKPRLLCDRDAAVLIGATLLHDIAMHVQPAGFLELVGETPRFLPLPWFKDEQEGHAADRPWRDLWLDYQREARRFSDRKLGQIIGEESARAWKFDGLPDDTGRWERNHCLIVGEFLRRHHARLAHEIAIYGFPGLPAGTALGQFPALGQFADALQPLADLIGLTARSHGLSLRVCHAYLRRHCPGTPKPMGCAVLYPMALLRVADYLQIDGDRAPAVLLKLRNPQSPVSLQEWHKHRAVQSIVPADDPRGVMVKISDDVSQAVYLQLRDLLEGLQKEMDHATAVLDEAYGVRADLGLDKLSLATRRVHSNLHNPDFRKRLPYVPERTGFATDPNLLSLLVEPLYGKEPGVGVRELMQNAVDAVRELRAWCENHGKDVNSLNLPDQEADVQIDFIEREDKTWFLRVTDKGIGMTADTIQNYFLRAGASFRQSSEWGKEFVDDDGKPRVLRAGRFGIGAFAVFLLGPRFRLWTRHACDETSIHGYFLETSIDSHLTEIRKVECPNIGTLIEVEISGESIKALKLSKNPSDFYRDVRDRDTDWFCDEWPVVNRRFIHIGRTDEVDQQYIVPSSALAVSPDWAVIYPAGFDAVYWTFDGFFQLICNGIKISTPERQRSYLREEHGFIWPHEMQLGSPVVSVIDRNAKLSLTAQRYALADGKLPFETELGRDVTLSFIAHALICGPVTSVQARSLGEQPGLHPLILYEEESEMAIHNSLLRWCSSVDAAVPADPWLYSLLNVNSCIIFGSIAIDTAINFDGTIIDQFASLLENCAVLPWSGCIDTDGPGERHEVVSGLVEHFAKLVGHGPECLAGCVEDVQLFISIELEHHLHERFVEGIELFYAGELLLRNITPKTSRRDYYGLEPSALKHSIPMDALVKSIENNARDELDDVLYVAYITTNPSGPKPESLIATVWAECLGPNPIPFDPEARRALIERGRQHTELKRHIEAWEEMKRTGSKWVTGGKDD